MCCCKRWMHLIVSTCLPHVSHLTMLLFLHNHGPGLVAASALYARLLPRVHVASRWASSLTSYGSEVHMSAHVSSLKPCPPQVHQVCTPCAGLLKDPSHPRLLGISLTRFPSRCILNEYIYKEIWGRPVRCGAYRGVKTLLVANPFFYVASAYLSFLGTRPSGGFYALRSPLGRVVLCDTATPAHSSLYAGVTSVIATRTLWLRGEIPHSPRMEVRYTWCLMCPHLKPCPPRVH